jgi:hypothetical protein
MTHAVYPLQVVAVQVARVCQVTNENRNGLVLAGERSGCRRRQQHGRGVQRPGKSKRRSVYSRLVKTVYRKRQGWLDFG